MGLKVLSIDNITVSCDDRCKVVSFDVVMKSSIFLLKPKRTRVSISNILTCPYYSRLHMTKRFYHNDDEIRLFCIENNIKEITQCEWFMHAR